MFTIQELINEVRKLAAENPDNKYLEIACYYDKGMCSNGSQGCIFGQAAQKLGIQWGGDESIRTLLKNQHIETSFREEQWCAVVQNNQDTNKSWKEAIERADYLTPNV